MNKLFGNWLNGIAKIGKAYIRCVGFFIGYLEREEQFYL
jgi:hypothetical protein